MAELGSTTDPRQLIPGSPEAIRSDIRAFTQHSGQLEGTGNALKRVDIGDWVGDAAHAFEARFQPQPPKWLKVSDLTTDASKQLTTFAEVLEWAQQQAGEAIELWERGEAATRRAKADHDAAVAAVSNGETVPPFDDPGADLRQQAQALLGRARQTLTGTGDTVASSLTGALDTMVDVVTEGWESTGKASFSGPDAGFSMSGPSGNKLGELKAFAYLFKASAEGELTKGDLTLSGEAGSSFGATGTAAASLENGLNARANVAAGLKAHASGSAEYGPASLNAGAQGLVGGSAHAGISADNQGLHASTGAFAGGKIKGTVGAEVGGVGVGFSAEGWAGAGAEAGVDFGMGDDGKFHVGAHAGAAFVFGGSGGVEVTIDPQEVAETAGDAAEAIGDGFEAAGSAIADGAETAWNSVT